MIDKTKKYHYGFQKTKDESIIIFSKSKVEDEDQIFVTLGDFINLQESPAGFGDTREEALISLALDLKKEIERLTEPLEDKSTCSNIKNIECLCPPNINGKKYCQYLFNDNTLVRSKCVVCGKLEKKGW